MKWDHRVIRTYELGEPVFAVHEVYYTKDGTPYLASELAVVPVGDTLAELQRELIWFQEAINLPILTWTEEAPLRLIPWKQQDLPG